MYNIFDTTASSKSCTGRFYFLTLVDAQLRETESHLDLGKNDVHINGAKMFPKQLCISAEFAKLWTIQVLNWHPHGKACK